MSSTPLENPKREKYCLLIVAGLDTHQAYQLAGYSPDSRGGNASKLLGRTEVIERIKWLKGETGKPEPALVDPIIPNGDPDNLMRQLLGLAYGPKTPPAVQLRSIELIDKLTAKNEAWPGDTNFSIDQLSGRQIELCQLFAARPKPESVTDSLMSKLATIRRNIESDQARLTNLSLPQQPELDQPAHQTWPPTQDATNGKEPRNIKRIAGINQR